MENRIAQLKADADKLMEKAETMCSVSPVNDPGIGEIGRASCRERV